MEDWDIDDDFAVTGTMIRYGGSFVRDLGHLFRIADDNNRRRLKAAFPEYWERYTNLTLQGQVPVEEG